jgi:hypothetical protein
MFAFATSEPAMARSPVSSLVRLSCEPNQVPKFADNQWICADDETGPGPAFVVEDGSTPPKLIGTVAGDLANDEVFAVAEVLAPSGFTRRVALEVKYDLGFGRISPLKIFGTSFGAEPLWFEDPACAGPPAVPAREFVGFHGLADFVEGVEVDPTFKVDILGAIYMVLDEPADPVAAKYCVGNEFGCTITCVSDTTTSEMLRTEIVIPIFDDWAGQFQGPFAIVEE